MRSLIHKSLRCLLFGFLLFAGATDLFSVDLDQDGDVDTDAVVVTDWATTIQAGVLAQRDEKIIPVHGFLRVEPLTQLIALPDPPAAPELALGSPQHLVPLRT